MSRPLFVKVNNAWKEGTSYIKVGGSWKQVTELGVRIAGSWKSSGEPHTTHVFDQQVVSPQYEIFPPRCIEDGLYYYSCSCGLSSAGITSAMFYVPATGADYNYSPLQYTTTDYRHAKVCQQCSGPHEYEPHVVSNWTQTAVSGTIVQLTGTCSVCGVTAKHTHDTSSTQNCEYCDLTVECQHLITETIPGSAASCTSSGLTEGVKCTNCGKVLQGQTIIPVLKHNFSSTWLYNVSRQRVSSATCTSDAVYTKECTRCVAQSTSTFTASQASGVSNGQSLEYALGHDYSSKNASSTYLCSDANCQSAATYYYKCSRCTASSKGDTNTTFTSGTPDAFTHPQSSLTYCAEVPATCTSTGHTAGYKCTACDEWTTGSVINKQTHNFSVLVDSKAATCETAGYNKYKCYTCTATNTITIAALNHNYNTFVKNQDNGDGTHSKLVKCSNAGCTSTTLKGSEKHTTSGCTGTTCTVCGATTTAAGHSWTTIEAAVPATCTTTGKTAKEKCSKCGTTRGGTTTGKLGHLGLCNLCFGGRCTRCGFTARYSPSCSKNHMMQA